MTIRNPKQLPIDWNTRLMEKPNKFHVIISKYSDEDDARNTYDLPRGHFPHIESIANKYKAIQYWNPELRLPNLERRYVKRLEDAKEFLCGSNPFAISFLEHGDCEYIQQGDESWLSVDELSEFINSNQGNVWMFWNSGCKSWHFGNNLVKKTDKILMMDARHKKKDPERGFEDPEQGFEFYDGCNDEERRLRRMKTISDWDLIFNKIYFAKVKRGKDFSTSWVRQIAINSGVSTEELDHLQGIPS